MWVSPTCCSKSLNRILHHSSQNRNLQSNRIYRTGNHFSDLAEKEGNRRSCRDVVVTRAYIHYVTRINAFVQRSRYPLMSRVYRKANGTRCKKRRESHVDRATAGTCDNAIEILTRGKHNTDRECSNFTK